MGSARRFARPMCALTAARAGHARVAVTVVFALDGLVSASWTSRRPAIRDTLALSEYQLGLLLWGLSCGAITALPPAGPLVRRWGVRQVLVTAVMAVSARSQPGFRDRLRSAG